MKKIAITTGDLNGIGYEVAAKALASLGPQKEFLYFIFNSNAQPQQRQRRRIEKKFNVHSFSDLNSALQFKKTHAKDLVEIQSDLAPAKWVELAAVAAKNKKLDALVTGPLSKPAILNSGMTDIGHTEILKRICNNKPLWMSFLGKKFNVFLLSGHLPLQGVDSFLTKEKLSAGLLQALKTFPSTKTKPLAVLGLNPHAGDKGILGEFEIKTLIPVIQKLRARGFYLSNPLVPDVAFQPQYWKSYSAYACCYHDQGLIPFKMTHGFSGVHMTAGLSFVRTSVDHGTGFDIFGLNKANPQSMIEAIEKAQELITRN